MAARARYAGYLSLLRWRERDVFVAYFVDPRHGHVYAQELPRTGIALDAPEVEPHWTFATARAFARWLGLASEAAWAKYVMQERPELPPVPLQLPAFPDAAFAAEWQSWSDWLKEPRAPGSKPAPAAAIAEAT